MSFINVFLMISNNFNFQDYSETLYSYATQQRFYNVVSKYPQLQKILIKKHSLQLLDKQSKLYKKMLWMTLGGSLIMLYPFNKIVHFGIGFFPALFKTTANVALVLGPLYYVNKDMRSKMQIVKKKAFEQNRAQFRKYELTGDVKQVNERIELVEQ